MHMKYKHLLFSLPELCVYLKTAILFPFSFYFFRLSCLMFPHGRSSQYSIYSLCFSRLLSGPRLQSRAFHVLPKTGRNTSAEAVPMLRGRMKLCSAVTILRPVQSIVQGLSGRRILRIHTEQTELRTWNYLMPFEIRNELCTTVAATVSFAVDWWEVSAICRLENVELTMFPLDVSEIKTVPATAFFS